MSDDHSQRIQSVIARLPDLLRRDLSSKDDPTCQRVEEALAAMVLSGADERSQADQRGIGRHNRTATECKTVRFTCDRCAP
jgi:hypothetical protein